MLLSAFLSVLSMLDRNSSSACFAVFANFLIEIVSEVLNKKDCKSEIEIP